MDTERRKRAIGRPSKAEPHRTFLVGELAKDLSEEDFDVNGGGYLSAATRAPPRR